MSAPLISVIIPTYNRADILRLALDSLLAQTLPAENFEVLVVDNNSRDHTRAVVEEYCSRQANVHYLKETAQGAAYARNCGLRAARGEYVGLMDDDCKAGPDWLTQAARVIRERHPVVIGGPFFPFYVSPRPVWFREKYGAYTLTDEARALAPNECAYGGNMFLRRDALQQVGGFPVTHGPVGNAVAFGEEIVPQQLIRKAQPDALFFYEPQMVTYNLVRPEQMKIKRVWREAYARGRSNYHLFPREEDTPLAPAAYRAAVLANYWSIAVDVLQGWVSRDKARFPHVQNYWYEHTRREFLALGRLRARHEAWCARSSTASESSTGEH